jgi:glycosyltransferase involved in cell wall biosynthesis
VVWLTNIPTPYRHHQLAALHLALDQLGVDLHVIFMAPHEPHRPWRYRPEDATYPHQVLTGPVVYIGDRPLHFNFGILRCVRSLKGTRSVLMTGGVSNPTAWLAMWARPRKWTTLILGIESNTSSERIRRGPAAWMKRHLIRIADGYYIPGEASRGYVLRHDPTADSKPWITLPNVIDEARFPVRSDAASVAHRTQRRAELGVGPEMVVLLVPARLEPFKGVLDLVSALELMPETRCIHVVFAGSGSLAGELRRRVANLPVTVLGHVADHEMPSWYAAADVMVLPSHRDSSPLAAVEALRSGLPLLLSDAVGNAVDAVVDGENGWVVPVGDVPALARRLAAIAAMPAGTLRAMGDRSEQIHRERFDTPEVAAKAAQEFSQLLRAEVPA